MANLSDGIPVGVCRQVRRKPEPLYEVLGLANVTQWENGYFTLTGVPTELVDRLLDIAPNAARELFDPTNIDDARKRTLAHIVPRQGQAQFRGDLLRVYECHCAISGREVQDVLEAAHIMPYKGTDTNKLGNGVLLRADVHTLFDLGLIAIDGATLRIVISPKLADTTYSAFEGERIMVPANENDRPSRAALDEHRRWAGL